jgi:hypothetical protein
MSALAASAGDTAAVPARDFPFSPKSSTRLELGDLIAVPCAEGDWAVLQVSALRRSGPGARTTLGVGVLPWHGDRPPTAEAIKGLRFVEHAMTAIEIFTEGGAEVVGAGVLAEGVQSNLHETSVGVSHKVWGWRTAMARARSAGGAV